jgi:hypothetical protein
MADPAELKNKLAAYYMESGHIPDEQELNDSADALLSFFKILIEADKKLKITNDRHNRADLAA